MLQKSGYTYLSLVLVVLLFQACATPKKRFSGLTISPPVPAKGSDLISTDPIQSIGIAKSGSFSGGFKVHLTDTADRISAGVLEGAGSGVQGTVGIAIATGGVGIAAAPVLVPFGMIMGAVEGPPVSNKTAVQLRLMAEEVVGYEPVQEKLAREVALQGQQLQSVQFKTFDLTCIPEYNCEEDFWETLDFDAVLEIQIVVMGLAATGDTVRPLQFFMNGWSRLIRTSDRAVIRTRPFVVRGMPQKTSYWLDINKDQLANDYHLYITYLAKRIVETMIGLPDTVPVYDSTYCWVKPFEPESQSAFNYPAASYVYTTTPLLRWTPFSTKADKSKHNIDPQIEITEVTYDLKIWLRKDGLWPVYEQSGLTETEHVVTTPLKKNHTYQWSVKVAFLENGMPRRTHWSHRIYKNRPPGWRSQSQEEEKPVWPIEWNLTNDDEKSLSDEALKRLICISGPELSYKFYMFKVR